MNDDNTTEPMVIVEAVIPLGSLRDYFRSITEGAGQVIGIEEA